jgi:hypothetical protein
VDTGGDDVMHRAWLCLGNPQREPVRGQHRLDVAAVGIGGDPPARGAGTPYPYIGALIGADALAEVLLQVLDALSLFLGHGLCGTFFMATKNLPP